MFFKTFLSNSDEFLSSIKDGWRWLAAGAVVGCIAFIFLGQLLPEKYHVTGAIKMAKVGGSDIEPPNQLLERFKYLGFYSNDVFIACDFSSDSNLSEKIMRKLIKGTNLVQISTFSKSPESGLACLNAVVELIRERQRALSAGDIMVLEADKDLLRRRLIFAKKSLQYLDDSTSNSNKKNIEDNFIINWAQMAKQAEVIDLEMNISSVERKLNHPQTQDVSLIEPLAVSNNLNQTNQIILPIVGFVFGLFFGFVGFVLKRKRCVVD